MINLDRAVTCLESVVGFRSSANTCLTPLATSLTGTTSGLSVMDEPGITQDILEAAKGDEYATLSDYLTFLRKASIRELVQRFINQHKDLTRARELLDNIEITKPMLGYFDTFDDKVAKQGRFVGIEIRPEKGESISVILRRTGVQFNTLNNGLKLYLYETTQQDAIKTFTLSAHTKVNSLEWFELTDFICSYIRTTGGNAARYFLGYFENDLLGQAIQTNLYLNCCGNDWVGDYQKYTMVRGVSFPSGALNGIQLPNTKQAGFSDQTFGLHLRMSVTCDITDTICDNKIILAPLMKKEIARRLMWDSYNSTRVNRQAELSRDRALVNIERLEKEIADNMKGIKLDFTDIDNKCMPCNKKFITSGQLR